METGGGSENGLEQLVPSASSCTTVISMKLTKLLGMAKLRCDARCVLGSVPLRREITDVKVDKRQRRDENTIAISEDGTAG